MKFSQVRVRTSTKKNTLRTDLERVKGDQENPEVVVKADEKTKSSIILEIMDAAQDAHYKKLIVAGEPLNKKEQKDLEKAAQQSAAQSNTINGASTAREPTQQKGGKICRKYNLSFRFLSSNRIKKNF